MPVGIPEDPVTGSAHCALAPYWAAKLGKKDFFAYQASARGGELQVHLDGERVLFAGQAYRYQGAVLFVNTIFAPCFLQKKNSRR